MPAEHPASLNPTRRPLGRFRGDPAATSMQHRCMPTAGCSRASTMWSRRRRRELAAAAPMAAPLGPAAHVLQAWLPAQAVHGRNRTVRSRGLSTAVQQPTAERGRAFDTRFRAHVSELKPLLLHVAEASHRAERGLHEQRHLRHTHAQMPSVRAAQSTGTAAHGGRLKSDHADACHARQWPPGPGKVRGHWVKAAHHQWPASRSEDLNPCT